LFSFNGTNGELPRNVVFGSGNLYGVTTNSGSKKAGTIFELSPTASGWVETTLHEFNIDTEGAYPWGGLVLDAAGNIYGTTAGIPACSPPLCGTVFELEQGKSWTLKTLHFFKFFKQDDGVLPLAALTFDGSGNLYGTTFYGGKESAGTVFELSPSTGGWSETIVHFFRYANASDGMQSSTGLLIDGGGNLFGTTSASLFEVGTVFEIKDF
jgi:uncharacterized repeat protein (TIGR03803 family)